MQLKLDASPTLADGYRTFRPFAPSNTHLLMVHSTQTPLRLKNKMPASHLKRAFPASGARIPCEDPAELTVPMLMWGAVTSQGCSLYEERPDHSVGSVTKRYTGENANV